MSIPSVHYQNKCKVQTPENTLNIRIKKKIIWHFSFHDKSSDSDLKLLNTLQKTMQQALMTDGKNTQAFPSHNPLLLGSADLLTIS